MRLNNLVLWALIAVAGVLILHGDVLVGVVVLATLFLNHAIFRALNPFSRNSTVATSEESNEVNEITQHEEPEFYLNLTDASLDKDYGWDRWTMYPTKMRLERSLCFGGPPTRTEIYKYEIRGSALFVCLLEKSEEGFDNKTYEVFNGGVVRAQIEAKCGILKADPEEDIKKLQSEIEWHEVRNVLRYFVLANTPGYYDCVCSERLRLERAYQSVAKEAEKLGAVWRDDYYMYVPRDTGTEEEKAAIHRLQSNENLSRFGISSSELFSQKEIMSLLSQDN